MNANCCETAEKDVIKKMIPLIKQYIQDKKHHKATVDLLKELICINSEFNVLLDIYLD